MQKPVRKETVRFEFNDKEKFNTDTDSQKIAKEAWDWVLNPFGLDYFIKNVKYKQIMII